MAAQPPSDHAALSLALAVVASSSGPLLLLDGALNVVVASDSFGRTFRIDPDAAAGRPLAELGSGEWKTRKLTSLLAATASGAAEVEAYEMDLKTAFGDRRIVIHAHKLAYRDMEHVRLLMAVTDVTDARAGDRLKEAALRDKDDLLREKAILLQEVRHRVANSLQIVASVLLQNARRSQSEETRGHLREAHQRVMSVAALERQLAQTSLSQVQLGDYFTTLCDTISASMIRDPALVSLRVAADDSSIESDASISLGLIVTELAINAVKHAFPDHHAGEIVVDYRAHGAGWKLVVSDNGVGMPKNARTAKAGLGTIIVQALARQLGAQVAVTNGHPGTAVTVACSAPATAKGRPSAAAPVEPAL